MRVCLFALIYYRGNLLVMFGGWLELTSAYKGSLLPGWYFPVERFKVTFKKNVIFEVYCTGNAEVEFLFKDHNKIFPNLFSLWSTKIFKVGSQISRQSMLPMVTPGLSSVFIHANILFSKRDWRESIMVFTSSLLIVFDAQLPENAVAFIINIFKPFYHCVCTSPFIH